MRVSFGLLLAATLVSGPGVYARGYGPAVRGLNGDVEYDIEPLDAGILVLDAANVVGMVYTGEYPKGSGTQHVFNGELWAARDDSMCLMALPAWPDTYFYPRPPSNLDLLVSSQTNWADRPPWVEREGNLDSWTWAEDERPGYYIGLTLESHGISFAGHQDEDFIFFNHRFRNRSDEVISGLYVGWKFDLDIGSDGTDEDESYADDLVGSDPLMGLVWMYDGLAENPYLGLAFFGRAPSGAAYYDEAGEPHGSADRWTLLTTTGWPEEDTPGDWRIIINTGPITLAPGEAENFTLAVIAGTDEADMFANLDRAAEVHDDIFTGIDEPPERSGLVVREPAPELNLKALRPNPSARAVRFAFVLPASGYARLSVYDLAGRLVATPYAGFAPAGETELAWEHGLAPGVYIARLEFAGRTLERKMAVVR